MALLRPGQPPDLGTQKVAIVKLALGVGGVALVLGVWVGAWAARTSHPTASGVVPFEAGLAIFLTGNFLLCFWAWYRAQPLSADARVMPIVALSSASGLLLVLPRVLWPGSETLHRAGLIASGIVSVVLIVAVIRQRRRRTGRAG
jgi:hypothetical protein